MTAARIDPWARVDPDPGAAADETERNGFGEWCIVELFGHRRAAGYVTQAAFPAGFLRLDIPECNGRPASTQFYSPSALYGLHPVTEELARQAAASFRPKLVHRYELPAPPERLPDRDMDDPEVDEYLDEDDEP